jgi:hypothetical protein
MTAVSRKTKRDKCVIALLYTSSKPADGTSIGRGTVDTVRSPAPAAAKTTAAKAAAAASLRK